MIRAFFADHSLLSQQISSYNNFVRNILQNIVAEAGRLIDGRADHDNAEEQVHAEQLERGAEVRGALRADLDPQTADVHGEGLVPDGPEPEHGALAQPDLRVEMFREYAF